MIQLFYSELIDKNQDAKLAVIANYYSNDIIKRIEASPSQLYRNRRITSRLMLIEIYNQLNLNVSQLKMLKYNNNGKLMTENYNISISYSENKAFCLTSTSKIGLDVEKMSELVSEKQIELLEKFTNNKISTKAEFYKMWTKVESIVKLYDNKKLSDVFFGNLLTENHHTNHLLLNREYMVAISSIGGSEKIEHINSLNTL